MLINRSDMLELTRRMTDTRTHLVRVAGAYMDEEGCVDGTSIPSSRIFNGRKRSGRWRSQRRSRFRKRTRN